MNNNITTFINEIREQKVKQSIIDKTCGALATFYGIQSRPQLLNKFIEYVQEKLETDIDFYNAVMNCTWYGLRRYWYDVFVYCIYKYDGRSAINVEHFLHCFENTFQYKAMDIFEFVQLPTLDKINYVKNYAVIVSAQRATSGTFHWFNITDIKPFDYGIFDEMKVNMVSELQYTLYDVVGMVNSVFNSSIVKSFKDYMFSTGNIVNMLESELVKYIQTVIIIG